MLPSNDTVGAAEHGSAGTPTGQSPSGFWKRCIMKEGFVHHPCREASGRIHQQNRRCRGERMPEGYQLPLPPAGRDPCVLSVLRCLPGVGEAWVSLVYASCDRCCLTKEVTTGHTLFVIKLKISVEASPLCSFHLKNDSVSLSSATLEYGP